MMQMKFSKPLSIKSMKVTDSFWKSEMELVRKEVIPYQWDALNDRVPGAAKSYCMRNFKLAGKMSKQTQRFKTYPTDVLETLPEEGKEEERFYGFFFQDSDFSKWIEAVGYSLAQHPDPDLEKIADEAIDVVCSAQLPNGYLDTYYIINNPDKAFTNLQDNHELYCMGHLIEGAVAYYDATGKDKLLQAARRYADYAESRLGAEEGKKPGYPGHEIAEMALVRLYEATRDPKYLKLSSFFIYERGTEPHYFDQEENSDWAKKEYYQAHLPVLEQREAVGHAVRAVYLYSGMADIARLTKDEALYESCKCLWDSITNEKMYITGGIGGTSVGEAFSYPYDLKNDMAYAETCASIGMVFFARRMLQIHPDSKYGDVLEREVYNGTISGMALDGKNFFYVNPLEVLPEACQKDERKSHVKAVRQKWFGCACCPPNLARMISSISTYGFTENEDTLFVHLYMGGEIEKDVRGKKATIKIESGFPLDGRVSFEIQTSEEIDFSVALRIPSWGRNYVFSNIEGAVITEEDGYLYLHHKWSGTERFSIEFPMEVRAIRANPKVSEDIGKVAITRGPLVFCMEEKDNGKDLPMNEIDLEGGFICQTEQLAGKTIMKIEAKGRKICPPAGGELYYEAGEIEYQDVSLQLVPYYTWANRGEGEMQVWIRQRQK